MSRLRVGVSRGDDSRLVRPAPLARIVYSHLVMDLFQRNTQWNARDKQSFVIGDCAPTETTDAGVGSSRSRPVRSLREKPDDFFSRLNACLPTHLLLVLGLISE